MIGILRFSGTVTGPLYSLSQAVNGNLAYNSSPPRLSSQYPNGNNSIGYIQIQSNVPYHLYIKDIDVANTMVTSNQANMADTVQTLHLVVIQSTNYSTWTFPNSYLDVADLPAMALINTQPDVKLLETLDFIPSINSTQTIAAVKAAIAIAPNNRIQLNATPFTPTLTATYPGGIDTRCYIYFIITPTGSTVSGSMYSYGIELEIDNT